MLATLIRVWHHCIETSVLTNFVDSMPKRIMSVLKVKELPRNIEGESVEQTSSFFIHSIRVFIHYVTLSVLFSTSFMMI